MPQDKQWECCQKCKAVGIPGMITTPWCDKWGNCPCHHTPTSPKTAGCGLNQCNHPGCITFPSPKSDWRNNILKTLGYDLDDEINIPGTLLNAIDAAYTAGLDDREKVVSKTEEEILEQFDKEFLCQIPEHQALSNHVFAHDKLGRLPQEFKKFISQACKTCEALGQQNGMRMVVEEMTQWLRDFANRPIGERKNPSEEVWDLQQLIRNKYNL